MTTYKLNLHPLSGEAVGVCKMEGDRQLGIPFDSDNTDYQEYLAWVAEGNEPLPAE